MKFAVLALLATASATITVSINDKQISGMLENWDKARWKLQRTLSKLEQEE